MKAKEATLGVEEVKARSRVLLLPTIIELSVLECPFSQRERESCYLLPAFGKPTKPTSPFDLTSRVNLMVSPAPPLVAYLGERSS